MIGKGGTLAVNGFTNQADPLNPPAVTGVSDGEIINLNLFDCAPVFDKGTATLTKEGGSAQAFTSGTKITEVGKYTLSVKIGTLETTVRFELIKPVGQSENLLDDYCSEKAISISNTQEGKAEKVDGGVKITKLSGDGYTEFVKQYIFDLSVKNYLVLDIRKVDNYTPDTMFAFELVCDTVGPWYIDSISGFENMNVVEDDDGWKIYIETKVYEDDVNKVKNVSAKFKVSIGGGGPKSIILQEFSKITEEEYNAAVSNGVGSLPDTFTALDGITKRNPDETDLQAVAGGVQFTKTAGDGWTRISKAYRFDLSVKNYLVLDIQKVDTWVPVGDAGFAIHIQQAGAAEGNYLVSLTGVDMKYVEYDGGWRIYIEMPAAAGDAAALKNAEASLHIEIGYGGGKALVLHEFKQITEAEYIAALTPDTTLDAYDTTDGITTSNAEEGKIEKVDGGVKITKLSGDGYTEFVKQYTFDLSVKNYLVLDIQKVDNYTPDPMFAIELVCDTVGPWYTFGISGFDKMKVVGYDGGWKIYIETSVYQGDVSTVKNVSAKFKVSIGAGGPKSVILHSLSQITEEEYNAVIAGL